MSLNDAAQYLRLVNEMPGSASTNWKIEELFQRDIDWPRVERKIVPYLKKSDQPQFFNSLTIALLPIRDNALGGFERVETWDAPSLDHEDRFESEATRRFGPITCGYWGNWETPDDDNARLGQLCWNTDQICGVAIDGQHRLAAIKQVVGAGSELYRGSSVPVLLVVLHNDLGFDKKPTRQVLVDTLRTLFIDLNKHARTVSRARQILLDDRDPASICVRAAVGTELCKGRAELQQVPPTLPLSLIDWHSEQAKFDVGPYLTTILGLDWAVANILSIRPFEDPMAFEDTGRLIDVLERKLPIQLDEAKDRLTECIRYQRPFSFLEEPENELARIARGFSDRWCRSLVWLLSQFSPYRSLIELRETHDTLTPEFANWYALKESADGATAGSRASQLLAEFEGHLSNRAGDPIAIGDFRNSLGEFDELKREHELAFTVVFQRALMLAFLQFTKITESMAVAAQPTSDFDIESVVDKIEPDDDSDDAETDDASDTLDDAVIFQRAEQLIAALNHLISEEPEVLKKECEFAWKDGNQKRYDRFWLCSLVQPEGPIDFTQGASKRAADILLLAGFFWLYRDDEDLGKKSFLQLVKRALEATNGMDLKLKQCFSRMYDKPVSVGGRIVSSHGEDVDDDDKRQGEILGRASWLWDIMWR